MQRVYILSFLLFFILSTAIAQKKIRLSKISSGRSQILKKGHRILYELKEDHHFRWGRIGEINDSFMVINNKEVPYHQLRAIGRKRFGSDLFQLACALAGVTEIAASVYPTLESCKGCPQSEHRQTYQRVDAALIGAAIISIGFFSSKRNRIKDVTTSWHLEVID